MRLAIANQKGGVGKTTTTVSMAAVLAGLGHRVLVVDMDPQANATAWLLRGHDGGTGLLNALVYGHPLQPQPSTIPGVDVIASSTLLVRAQEQGATVGSLKAALNKLPSGQWDYILVDCPPSLGLLMVLALVAAEEVLIPVNAEVMPMRGIVDLMKTIGAVQQRLNAYLKINGILVCRYDMRTNLSRTVVERLNQTYGRAMYRSVVRANVRVAEAPSHYLAIEQYDRLAGLDYRNFVAEFLSRQGKVQTHA